VLCLRKRCAMRVWWGAVAQLGERLVRNEEVSGSIPLSSTKEDNCGINRDSPSLDLRRLSCDFPEYSQFRWSLKVLGRG
jgi:hypothetical protein